MNGRRMLGIVVIVAWLGVGCASMQDDKMAAKTPLYDRLGGKPAITAVVDDFIGTVAGDSRINQRFAGTNIPRLKSMLVDQAQEKNELLGALAGMKGQIVGQ